MRCSTGAAAGKKPKGIHRDGKYVNCQTRREPRLLSRGEGEQFKNEVYLLLQNKPALWAGLLTRSLTSAKPAVYLIGDTSTEREEV